MGLLPSPNYIKVLSGSGESKSKATSKAKSKAKSKEPGRTWTSSLVHDPALIHHECALTPGSILGGRSAVRPQLGSGNANHRSCGRTSRAPLQFRANSEPAIDSCES